MRVLLHDASGAFDRDAVPKRRRLTFVSIVAGIPLLLASCSADETATGSVECDDGALRVPAPQVISEDTEAAMDLLFIEHQACAADADGAANLGVEPSVIATDGRFRVEVSPEFEVRYVVTSAGEEDAPLVEGRAAGSDDALVIDVLDAGCQRLVVELVRGDLTGRFVSRLETSDDACPASEG